MYAAVLTDQHIVGIGNSELRKILRLTLPKLLDQRIYKDIEGIALLSVPGIKVFPKAGPQGWIPVGFKYRILHIVDPARPKIGKHCFPWYVTADLSSFRIIFGCGITSAAFSLYKFTWDIILILDRLSREYAV